MPCYDPPPPWEEIQKKNAEQAVVILCRYVTEALNDELIIEPEILTWYLAHREIDLTIATTPHYGKTDSVAAKEAKKDIERVKLLIGGLKL